jgi:hypothetical protein
MNTARHAYPLLAAFALLAASPVRAQFAAFEYEPGRVPVGTVLDYVKATRDGSHESRISIYLAARDRIESLQWEHGGSEATLVAAQMDWPRYSVKHFESWHLAAGKAPEMKATLDAHDDEIGMSLMNHPVKVSHWPWHSYDFDFASLSLVMTQLRDPRADFSFWRTDYVYGDSPSVGELGEVKMHFERQAQRNGRKAWRYSIGGPGLGNQQGIWWSDRLTGLLVEYELPVGDEPGYPDVRLKLSGVERMSAAQWDSFKNQATAAR